MKHDEISEALGFNLMDSLPENLQNLEFIDQIVTQVASKDPVADVKENTGVSQEQLEALYNIAYNFYERGLYEKAFDIFKMLVIFDQSSYKFNFGSAACLQMMGEYLRAIQVYFGCALLDEISPDPYFYALECSLKMHSSENAIFCAQKCIERSKDKKEYDNIRKQSEAILKTLQEPKKPKKKKKSKKAKKKG